MVPLVKAGAMRGGIDAARQTRDDAEAGLAQFARQPLGEFHAGGRGVARADNGDHRLRQDGASLPRTAKQRRRIVDHLQARRIIRLAERDQFDAARAAPPSIRAAASSREQMRDARGAAAARERGQGVERGARAAVMVDQVAEGARPDIVAADEPQPVEPLLVGQSHAVAVASPPPPRPPAPTASAHYNRVSQNTTGG